MGTHRAEFPLPQWNKQTNKLLLLPSSRQQNFSKTIGFCLSLSNKQTDKQTFSRVFFLLFNSFSRIVPLIYSTVFSLSLSLSHTHSHAKVSDIFFPTDTWFTLVITRGFHIYDNTSSSMMMIIIESSPRFTLLYSHPSFVLHSLLPDTGK